MYYVATKRILCMHVASFPGPAQLFLSYSIWKRDHVSDVEGKEDFIEDAFPKRPQRELVTLHEHK